MKQVGDGFFENEVQKYVSGTELRTIAGHSSGSLFVPQVGTIMRCGCRISECVLCVMRLTILLSLCAMKLSRCGVVAQLVEHHNGIVGVVSSNLIGSTRGQCSFVSMCRSGEIGRHA